MDLLKGLNISGKGDLEVSIVFPAYNEADKLERAVIETINYVKDISRSFEIIIAEDGSTDGTDKLAEELSRKIENVRRLHSDVRLGRGRALNRAFSMARGKILIYMDVDLSTELEFLKPLIDSIRNEGFDLATGSRMLPQSVAERRLHRRILSKIYNFLVRALLKSPIRDHQCGFKAFRREAFFTLMPKVKANHWFWDTEVLVLASRIGFKIKEIPVVWRRRSGTKVSLRRDVLDMGIQVLKLWFRLTFKE